MVVAWRTTSLHCRTALTSLVGPLQPSWLHRCRVRAMTSVRSAQSTENEPEINEESQPEPKRRVHWDQLPQSRFTELGIDKSLYAQAGGARFRQHVNPLKRELQVPAEPLEWSSAYEDPSLPLILDIGCGYGRFLLALANAMPGYNGLGLEIREPVVDRANRWAEGLSLQSRVRFVLANATVSLNNMLRSFPAPLSLVTIQYPDPHFKKRHRKRRVVQPQLVTQVRDLIAPGGRLFLQSDVLSVAEDMRDQFEREAGDAFELAEEHSREGAVFYQTSEPELPTEGESSEDGKQGEETEIDVWESTWIQGGWLKENPLPVPTERELHVLSQGLPVYRVMLVRK